MYTAKDAQMEEQDAIEKALDRRDDEFLLKLASQYAETAPDYADEIRNLAKKVDSDNWAHDRQNDN